MNKDTSHELRAFLITDFFKSKHQKKPSQESESLDNKSESVRSRLSEFNFSLEDQIQSDFPEYIIRVLGLENMLSFTPVPVHMLLPSDDGSPPEIALHTIELIDDIQFNWDYQNRPYICFKLRDPDGLERGVLTLTCHQNNEWYYCWVKCPCIFSPFTYKDNNIPLANALIDPKVPSEEKERILRALITSSEKIHDVSGTRVQMC